MTPAEADKLQAAIALATRAHENQYRKFTGEPYIVHPLRVMLALGHQPLEIQIAAVLHDVVEDTHIDLSYIRREFGDEVTILVDALTRRDDEDYRDFILRIRSTPLAIPIKLEDIGDNLHNLPDGSLKTRYLDALEFLKRET